MLSECSDQLRSFGFGAFLFHHEAKDCIYGPLYLSPWLLYCSPLSSDSIYYFYNNNAGLSKQIDAKQEWNDFASKNIKEMQLLVVNSIDKNSIPRKEIEALRLKTRTYSTEIDGYIELIWELPRRKNSKIIPRRR